MSGCPPRKPLRVEQALRLLPEVESVAPLGALLLALSRPARPEAWTSEPCETVGKRVLEPSDLRARLPRAVRRISDQLGALYGVVVDALEAEQRGDLSEAARALLRAGEIEEKAGRSAQAREWYLHALGIAEELRDRRPEIEALQRMGSVESARGDLEGAARTFQRSLALAEAELDGERAAAACRGLGNVAAARSQWAGAESWFSRGLEHARGNALLEARFTLELGATALARNDEVAAGERIGRARAVFESAGDSDDLVRALYAEGLLAARKGHTVEALARLTEAVERLDTGARGSPLEIEIRSSLGELLFGAGRIPDAEDELRRAEELAIAHQLPHLLARLYIALGKVRAAQDDENGFVFFEKALELCSGPEPAPKIAAEVWREYARFRTSLGQLDEAHACSERARVLLEQLGEPHAVTRLLEDLSRLPPPVP